MVITQHGRAKAVLMDVREHDRLRETLAMVKLLAQSEVSLAKGARTYTTNEVRASARAVLTRPDGMGRAPTPCRLDRNRAARCAIDWLPISSD